MSSSTNNISVSPVNVYWQIEQSEQVDFTGVTAAAFGGTSFALYSAADAVQYYVWGDENSTDSDPVETGTGIEVDYAASASATAIATAVAAAIDAVSGFDATSSGAVVTINRTAYGACTDTVDIDSGVTITKCREGRDFDLGLLQGDIELSAPASSFIVTAHQTGLTPRAALLQGFSEVSCTTVLLETQLSNLKEFYEYYGAAFTPSGGTEVFGYGTSRNGENLLLNAARLVLKPVNAANDLNNVTMMLAVPTPSSLLFSGENPRTLTVEWAGFVDDQIDSRVSALNFGDQTQAGLRA